MKNIAIILAAGKGTRFGKSKVNKNAVKINGKSLIQIGIDKVEPLFDEIIIVVGYKKESIISSIEKTSKIHFVEQVEQKGTGHAVNTAIEYIKRNFSDVGHTYISNADHLFMIDKKLLNRFFENHISSGHDATILTTYHPKPYFLDNGRVKRNNHVFEEIVERKDLDQSEEDIKELNTGNYFFKHDSLLKMIDNNEDTKTGEIRITDWFKDKKWKVGTHMGLFEQVGTGVNSKSDLKRYLKNGSYDNFKTNVHRLIENIAIIAIVLILLGKLFVRIDQPDLFLSAYGIAVTAILWMVFFVSFRFYKDPFIKAINNKDLQISNELVSCMVAVKDEEINITRCIDSMLAQTYQNKEIIVVNDASTDKTLEKLIPYEKSGKITLINLKTNLGKKKALAKAMLIAKGSIFAHTDSDSIWAPDVIERAVTIFADDPKIGAISGHGRALNGNKNLLTKIQDSWMEGQFSMRKAFESVFNAVTCVSGPLAVFRKEAIFNFIPAWENDKFLGEEFKFATDRTLTGFVLGNNIVGNKLKSKYKDSEFIKIADYAFYPWKVVYSKSLKSWTNVPDNLKLFIKQQIRWKKSFIRNIFFTGGFYWRKPLPTSLVYYFHIIFVLAGPFITFRHLIYLPFYGNILSGLLYLSGIIFVGFMFGIAYKLEDKGSNRWMYRPLMSLMSTLFLSWLVFYSILTIKKMSWTRS